jgi:hypothetical protein
MSKNKNASKFDRELNKIISEVSLSAGFDFSDDESDCSDILTHLEKKNMVFDGDDGEEQDEHDAMISWVPDENPYKKGNNEVLSAFDYAQRGKSVSTANDNAPSRNKTSRAKKPCGECGKHTTGFSFLDGCSPMCGVCNKKVKASFESTMKAAGF